MATDFEQMMNDLRDSVDGIFHKVHGAEEREMPRAGLSTLFAPVHPYNRWSMLSPIVAAGGVAALFGLCGVAVVAFAAMMLALWAMWFLLSEVFGYELSFVPMPR